MLVGNSSLMSIINRDPKNGRIAPLERQIYNEPEPVLNARWIPLTKGKWVLVDEDDFDSLSKYLWMVCINKKKSGKTVLYASREEGGKRIFMHHAVFGSKTLIDHINRNGLDNRKANLRMATNSQNNANKSLQSNNTSGYKGVCWDKSRKKWIVQIKLNGKRVFYKRYEDLNEAISSYNKTALIIFKDFVYLNPFPE